MHRDYRHRPRWVFIAMILSGLVLVGGCRSRGPSVDESPSSPVSSNAETTETPPANSVATVVGLFFVRNDRVGYVQHAAAAASEPRHEDPGSIAPILEALLEGPLPQERNWGFSSAIPAGTELLDISASETLVTIDLSDRFMADEEALSMQQRIAQVVFTLTALDGIERVAIEINGEPLRALGAPGLALGPSVSRDDFADVRPDILVLSPVPGETITSPVNVSGESNTPGGTFVVEVVGTEGAPVTEQLVDGSGTNGTWRAFDSHIEFDTGTGSGELVGYWLAPTDGSRAYEIRIPVVFE